MKLIEAQELVNTLKNALFGEYWVHVYYLRQNGNLLEADWEYDVYVEYNGEFNIERFSELLNFIGELSGLTYTLAIPTHQIIIW